LNDPVDTGSWSLVACDLTEHRSTRVIAIDVGARGRIVFSDETNDVWSMHADGTQRHQAHEGGSPLV